MAKIFIAFFNGIDDPNDVYGVPCFFDAFFQGLINLGNELLVFQSKKFFLNFEKHDDLLKAKIKEIKEFNPDLILLFNNSFCDISQEFDCPIIIYEVDSPLYYQNKKSLLKNKDRYKFFVPQTDTIKFLQDEWKINKKNILYTPFFSSVKAVDIPFTTNISFIGTKFTQGCYQFTINKFMSSTPNESEIEEFKNVLEYYATQPFLTKEEIIANLSIKSNKVIRYVNPDILIWEISDTKRVRTLATVADLGLKIYGTPNWYRDMPYEPDLTFSYMNKYVYSLKHNQDIYNSSRIGININHLQAKSGFAWRVCDIMASNACLVTEYKPDIEKLFPKLQIPFFTNRFEAREQCIKLLKNENQRKDIVMSCQNVINENYRFKHLISKIEHYLNLNLHNEQVGSIKYLDTPQFAKSPEYKPQCSLKNKMRLNIYKYLKRKLEDNSLI